MLTEEHLKACIDLSDQTHSVHTYVRNSTIYIYVYTYVCTSMFSKHTYIHSSS